jgi:hypothetical protein
MYVCKWTEELQGMIDYLALAWQNNFFSAYSDNTRNDFQIGISRQIQIYIRKQFRGLIRGPGACFWWKKKPTSKISCKCTFKVVIRQASIPPKAFYRLDKVSLKNQQLWARKRKCWVTVLVLVSTLDDAVWAGGLCTFSANFCQLRHCITKLETPVPGYTCPSSPWIICPPTIPPLFDYTLVHTVWYFYMCLVSDQELQ